jgi:hypothetical protein
MGQGGNVQRKRGLHWALPCPYRVPATPIRSTATRAPGTACGECLRAQGSSRAGRPAWVRARVRTASSIASVTRPVKVFCWLGW